MKKHLLVILLIVLTSETFAQTSVVQDTKGETSLALGNVGVVAINAKDESISFSYGISLNKPKGTNETARNKFNYLGFSVKGKGKNGLINIIKNDEFQYDGSIGLFYFQDRVNDSKIFQWYVSSDFLFSQFKLFDSSSSIAFTKQVYDNNAQGYKITGGFNTYGKLVGSIPYVLGFALNGGHKNNTTDIKSIEVANFVTQVDPITSQTRLIQKDKSNAYSISDYRGSLAYSNINLDGGIKVFDQILPMLHLRWSMQENRKPQFNPAFGLYVTKSGAPLEVVAGIQVQTLDWANTAGSVKTRSERTTVNIVAGFTF